MEKEIYITETPYHCLEPNETNIIREKNTPVLNLTRSDPKPQPRRFLDHLPHENYYDDKQLKPGITFFKTILDIEERRTNGQYSGPMLKMNIPETVLLTDNMNSLISSSAGIVKVDSFVSNETFLEKINLKQFDNEIFPIVIHSSISGISFNNSILMTNEIMTNKIIPRSQGFICRKFIRPYADSPNMLRLYYTAVSQKSLKKNHGYKMVNNVDIDSELLKKKHRHTHDYLVFPERQGSYSITLVKGKSLEPFEQMAYSLTQYLQKAYPLRVTELVLDFIIDSQKTPWLLDVKAIRSKQRTKLWDIGGLEEIQLLTEKNNNSQICKLCRMSFAKQELQKLVTNKLIWELTTHLQGRGVAFQSVPHLRKEGLSTVCSICYELIVAEHQLIDVEKEFSALLNISSSTIERVQQPQNEVQNRRMIWDESDYALSALNGFDLPKLKAWRLFFYIERIKYMDSLLIKKPNSASLEMKFSQFKQTFTKNIPQSNDHYQNINSRFSYASRAQSAKLKQSLLGENCRPATAYLNKTDSKCQLSQTTMASKISGSITHTRQCLDIEKVKVMVLYTKKHQPGNMFEDTELTFNLNIDDQKFEGRSFTLQQLKNKDTCQRHSSEVFLFNEKMQYCNLEVTVGLICDGEADLDELALEEANGIYYHSRPNSICLPLPDQWMEVFTKGEEVPTRSQELFYEDIHREVPKMSKSRMRLKPLLPN